MQLKKKELCDILGIQLEGLKSIEKRHQLNERLENKGYKLISKTKVGRNVIYNIEKVNESKEIYYNLCKYVYGTNDIGKFSKYFCLRVFNVENPITKREISNSSGANKHNIKKWDDKMIENKILDKDGYFYMAIDYNDDGTYVKRLTDKYEYLNFVKDSKFAKRKQELITKYKKDELDEEDFWVLYDAVTNAEGRLSKKFIYRINKFKLNRDNQLYRDTWKLICETYGLDYSEFEECI